jgi:hypothetical protein
MPVLRREAREAGTVDLFGTRERSVEGRIADDGRLPEWNVPDARHVRKKLSFATARDARNAEGQARWPVLDEHFFRRELPAILAAAKVALTRTAASTALSGTACAAWTA